MYVFISCIRIVNFKMFHFDPFDDQISTYDIYDKVMGVFRDHKSVDFDDRIVIVNSADNDRKKIAKLLLKLNALNCHAIGLDVILDEKKEIEGDSLLRNALLVVQKKIVLAEEERGKIDPYFCHECITGSVNVMTQDGISVKVYMPRDNNKIHFTSHLADMVNHKKAVNLSYRNNDIEWINFRRKQPSYSPDQDLPNKYWYFDIDDFLENYDSPSSVVKNKVILIGHCGLNPKFTSMSDRWITPLNGVSGKSFPDMHGVVVLANILSMVLDQDFIDEVPKWYMTIITFYIFMWLYHIYLKRQRKRESLFGKGYHFLGIRVLHIGILLLLVLFSGILMNYANLKIPIILLSTFTVISYEIFEIYETFIKNRINRSLDWLGHRLS